MNFTVIITCFNKGILLKRAYQSLQKQTYKSFKIVLVNDCSDDIDTEMICESISKKSNVIYVRNPSNMGVSFSKDLAFNLSENGVIITLDADDTLPDNAIENIKNIFESDSTIEYVYGDYYIIDERKNTSNYISLSHYKDELLGLNPWELAKNWLLLGSSPCTKNLWERIGGYDNFYSHSIQDQDFWQRVIINGAKGRYINAPIYNWYKYPGTISTSTPYKDYYYIKKKNKEFHKRYSPVILKYGYYPVLIYLYFKMHWKQFCSDFNKCKRLKNTF